MVPLPPDEVQVLRRDDVNNDDSLSVVRDRRKLEWGTFTELSTTIVLS